MTRYQTAVLENGLRIIALSNDLTSGLLWVSNSTSGQLTNYLTRRVLLISASMLPSKVLLAEQQLMLFNVLSK